MTTPQETTWPSEQGYFGSFGGRFVAEPLVAPLLDLQAGYERLRGDTAFWEELLALLHAYAGRPSALTPCVHFGADPKAPGQGAAIYLKREDLLHTGSASINSVLGQALLAQRLGKKRIIAVAETGPRGVATAAAAARLGLACTIYVGRAETATLAPHVLQMQSMGASVVSVEGKGPRDAIREAWRDWGSSPEASTYVASSAVGPHPFPTLARDFQSIIGTEARQQMLDLTGRLPDMVVAGVGGGGKALGIFYGFTDDPQVRLVGVEAGGQGPSAGENAASLAFGSPGVLNGSLSYLLQDPGGQVQRTRSIAPELDRPEVGPEHAWLKDSGRVEYTQILDEEALSAFRLLAREEGILPSLEAAHALAAALQHARELGQGKAILVCLSGRSDLAPEALDRQGEA